ncbi:MAG: hypothetical protein H8M99_14400 [Gloeobacteraceae cyanobacterium ES-bin-144]|nr:hypothetical protein [Verrucomicrobiales bacterium]
MNCSAAPLTVTDKQGRSIDIELVAVSGESVTFRRQGDAKTFTLAISSFADDSQKLIRAKAADIPAALPKIEANVVIGKRRKKEDSWYMETQEVTSTVKLTNADPTNASPALTGKIIFLGQEQRTPDLLCVLSTQSFDATVEATKTFSFETKPFFTTYDSDNKGQGNVGGYQYYAYVLIVKDAAGKIILDETSNGTARLAIKNKPKLLEELYKHPDGAQLTSKLESTGQKVILPRLGRAMTP